MTRFFTESRQATVQQPNYAEPRFQAHPTPVQVTSHTREDYQSSRSNVYNDGGAQPNASHIAAANDRPFFTRDTHHDYTGHTTGATQYAPYTHTHTQERSVLIPYDDLRTARSSLPEFTGTRAEDPVRYIANTESILVQANIGTPIGLVQGDRTEIKRIGEYMVQFNQGTRPILEQPRNSVPFARRHRVNTTIAQAITNGICVQQKPASAPRKYRPIRIGIIGMRRL